MLVTKQRLFHPFFTFEHADATLPIEVGYETYGAPNDAGDNAILICHALTTSGHAAGKYTDADPASGWWDDLIGPGKPIDTDRHFVISCDSLANVNTAPEAATNHFAETIRDYLARP